MDRFQRRAEDDELRGREGKGRLSPRGHRGEKTHQTANVLFKSRDYYAPVVSVISLLLTGSSRSNQVFPPLCFPHYWFKLLRCMQQREGSKENVQHMPPVFGCGIVSLPSPDIVVTGIKVACEWCHFSTQSMWKLISSCRAEAGSLLARLKAFLFDWNAYTRREETCSTGPRRWNFHTSRRIWQNGLINADVKIRRSPTNGWEKEACVALSLNKYLFTLSPLTAVCHALFGQVITAPHSLQVIWAGSVCSALSYRDW